MNMIAQRIRRDTVKNNRLMPALLAVVCCAVFAASGYAQSLESGEVEATGQAGIAAGIGTHASFAGSVGKALNDRVFVLGEFGYIPLGGANASGTGFEVASTGRVLTFMAGAQYQFNDMRSFTPYAGGGLGVVHAGGSVSSTVGGTTSNASFSSNNFYVNFGGGARYYVRDSWGFKPELMIFAGEDSFFRFSVGMFYQFRR